jgi:hypothetical protein
MKIIAQAARDHHSFYGFAIFLSKIFVQKNWKKFLKLVCWTFFRKWPAWCKQFEVKNKENWREKRRREERDGESSERERERRRRRMGRNRKEERQRERERDCDREEKIGKKKGGEKDII